MEKTITVCMARPMTPRMAAQITARIAACDARVLIRRENTTVNAKSLMGLASLGLKDGERILIMTEGPQEALAAQMLEEALAG